MVDLLGAVCPTCSQKFGMEDLDSELIHGAPCGVWRCPDCRFYMHREGCVERHLCEKRAALDAEKLRAWSRASES